MDTTDNIVTKSAGQTQKVGKDLADTLLKKRGEGKSQIVCLYGDLGSGKTTFVQGFAKRLGISGRLLSPTFIIVRRYEYNDHAYFYHMDCYRIESQKALEGLGIVELFQDPHALFCIEWAERLGVLLPKERTDVIFENIGGEKRRIRIKEVKSEK